MVNVPGRSKGCNTCRRRKKGCDLQKPVCGRCIRDNQTCEGYERSTIFVAHQPEQASSGSTKVPAVRNKSPPGRRSGSSSPVKLIPLREDLMHVAYQQEAFGRFCHTYLPKGQMAQGGAQPLTQHVWISTLLQLAVTSPPLRQALCALSLSSVGNSEGDDYKIRQGAEHYGAAVVRLNLMLQSDAVLSDEAIIPTCQLLSYYEQFNGFSSTKTHSQGRNWRAHSAGMAKILQHRQPYRQMSESGHIIFRQTRLAQMAYWCGIRKACPFASPDWQIPSNSGPPPSIRDKLFDILVDVPGLLERSDKAQLPGFESLRVPLIHDCLATHQRMQNWLLSTQHTLKLNDPDWNNNPYFVDETEYLMLHGMDIAGAVMFFWAVSILLCGTLRLLSQGVAPEHRVITDADDAFNPHMHASKIARCLHHFLNADAGLVGFQTASFPLGMALMYFAAFHDTEIAERETIRRHLYGTSSVKPYGPLMGAFLQQIQDDTAKRFNVKKEVGQADTESTERLRSKVWYQGKVRLAEPVA